MKITQIQANRIHTADNPYQGANKKVLCVCSAGLLRSPTAAWVLSNAPYNYNTRAAGIEESYALIPVDQVLLRWADEVVCMTKQHEQLIRMNFPDSEVPVVVLGIPDNFPFKDPELIKLIRKQYDDYLNVYKGKV